MKNHLKIWLPAILLLLVGQASMIPTPAALTSSDAHPTDICELPPPDTGWIIGATGSTITLGWSAVTGAYQYKVVVANLDGGSAPLPQYILAPTTQATFSSLVPGKYLFKITTTGCVGGGFGQARDVVGGTAIIIAETILENCAPTNPIAPLQQNTSVCIPYGTNPDEATELMAYEIKGSYDPPGLVPAFNWTGEFNILMPCTGSFAFSVPVATNAAWEITGGPGTQTASIVKFHPQSIYGIYDAVDLFQINGFRWWSTPPNPLVNNGCNTEYTASFNIQLGSASGLTITSMKRTSMQKDGVGYCTGQLSNPGNFDCLLDDPITRPANPGGSGTEAVPFEWENQSLVQLQVAPNPFREKLDVAYRLDQDAPLDLALYNTMGRRLKTLEQHELTPAGVYRSELDAADLPNGLYYLVLQTDQERRIVPVVKNE